MVQEFPINEIDRNHFVGSVADIAATRSAAARAAAVAAAEPDSSGAARVS